MGDKPVDEKRRVRSPGDTIISAVAVGTVLILIGIVFVLALPNNLWERTVAFFSNLTVRQVPGTSIWLPAPTTPNMHTIFYTAVFQFTLGIAFLQILILALRLAFRSQIGRIAETIGNLIFWFGASYLQRVYLLDSTTLSGWFTFWAAILIVLGLSIIVRAVVLIAKR